MTKILFLKIFFFIIIQLQSQVDVLKVRFHDKEDDTKRSRQEYQQAIEELDVKLLDTPFILLKSLFY